MWTWSGALAVGAGAAAGAWLRWALGIALNPEHGNEASTLLRHAEIALIAALGSEDPVAVYDAATDPHRQERLTLMTDLREALDRDQLRLHYQPKLRFADNRIDSAWFGIGAGVKAKAFQEALKLTA